MMQIKKINPWRSEKYKKHVRSYPCLGCLQTSEIQAHHEDSGFYNKGMGIKPPDSQCVPLCHVCHDEEGHGVKTKNRIKLYHWAMIKSLCQYIDKEFNKNPLVLIVNLLTEWIQDEEANTRK